MTELEWCRANAPESLKNESDEVLLQTMHTAYVEYSNRVGTDGGFPAEQISALAESIANIELAPIDPSEKVDEEKVNWYVKRFEQFKEDGVPAAISAYVEHLQSEGLNDITMTTILQKACDYL